MKSHKVQVTVAVVIGLLCLYFFAKDMDWPKVWTAMSEANYGLILLAVLIGLFSMVIRAFRWQSLLGEPKVTTGKLFLIMSIGFMGNGVFPARMGELIRPFLVWRSTPHRFSTALATIVVERVFDLLGILLILAYVFYTMPFPTATTPIEIASLGAAAGKTAMPSDPRLWMQQLSVVGLWIFIALFAVIGTLTYAPDWSLRAARKLFTPLPLSVSDKLLKMVVSFEKGASTFRRPLSFLYCLFLTLLLWVTIAVGELVTLWAFHIYSVSFSGSLFLMAGLCFAVMFPQLPGYIGPYQWAVMLILTRTFSVNESLSGAVALVMWFSQVPPVIVLGFICLVILGVSFQEISHVQEKMPDAAGEENGVGG